MTTQTISTRSAATLDSQRILEGLFSGLRVRDFDVRFWDGSVWQGNISPPRFTLVLRHEGSLRRMFWPPRLMSFGLAYVYDDFEIEGDMLAFQNLCDYLCALPATQPMAQKLKFAWRVWRLPSTGSAHLGRPPVRLSGAVHSRERDRAAVGYHYDLPDIFFEKMLGPTMLYTSAVFDSPTETLEIAQQRKLELVCRKLRLRPNDRLLDIGCGWGTLAMFAAKNYGVRVLGVTLGQPQATWAQARIREAGLEDRCRVEVADYRDLNESETFDQIACVEVGEHFGAGQFPGYWEKCRRLLRPGGTVFHQQITLAAHTDMPGMAREFMHRFIFPDGELVPLNFLLRHAEEKGLEIRDVECFREHYPLTLRHWLANIEANERELIAATDEATYRAFRLYLGGAVFGFERNCYNLYQMLLVKPNECRSGLPLAQTGIAENNVVQRRHIVGHAMI